MTIPRDQYEAFETLILSGQIEQSAVPSWLGSDPDFSKWYGERAEQRRNRNGY